MSRERMYLSQEDIPRRWYNLLPDLPEPLPAYKDTGNKRNIKDLPEIFGKTASKLEFSDDRWIEIPDEVLNAYIHCGRPCPLFRARRLEEFLKTPARIYYKCENLSPVGTFKINTALPQAYWAMKDGYKRTVFAGVSKSRTKFAHVFAAKTFGLTPTLFMTREDCGKDSDQLFFLKKMLEADLLESPSSRTEIGRRILKENPNHLGSREIVDEEIAEEVRQSKDAVAIMSSFLNHILMTQTIIGLEVEKQLKLIDEEPNTLIASVGAGSSFYGLIAPFMREYLRNNLSDIKFLAVESEISSKLTNGRYEYISLQGPLAGLLVKVYEFDWRSTPHSIIGAGIQTKNTAPILSFLRHLGFIDTLVYPKDEKAIFEAARIFLQTEGHLLAPESAYTMRAVIDEAIEAKKKGEAKVVVVSVSGTSYLDFGEKRRYTSFVDKS